MRVLGLLGLLIGLVPFASDARCLDFDPTVVTLVGELSTKRVPGPPGYRSLRSGDLPETIVLLTLDAPICVYGDPDSSINPQTRAGISEVQLIVPVINVQEQIGQRLRVTGRLVSARSGHHRTPVVLQVDAMRGG